MAKRNRNVIGEGEEEGLAGLAGRYGGNITKGGKPLKFKDPDEKRGRENPRRQNDSTKNEKEESMKRTTVTTAPTIIAPVAQKAQSTATVVRPQNARPVTAPVQQLAHPNDSQGMKTVLNLAILPPMKVNGEDNPEFISARNTLRNAMNAVDPGDLGRKVNLFAQRTISGTATPQEISAMFGIYTAQGRRWQARDVLAVKNAVAAIKTSRPALTALLTETFSAPTREGPQTRSLAHQVPNTTYVSYAYGKEALPAYLGILKANGLTVAATELEHHIGESNMSAVLAQQRKATAKAKSTQAPAKAEA